VEAAGQNREPLTAFSFLKVFLNSLSQQVPVTLRLLKGYHITPLPNLFTSMVISRVHTGCLTMIDDAILGSFWEQERNSNFGPSACFGLEYNLTSGEALTLFSLVLGQCESQGRLGPRSQAESDTCVQTSSRARWAEWAGPSLS
jgi:hypothetical protein